VDPKPVVHAQAVRPFRSSGTSNLRMQPTTTPRLEPGVTVVVAMSLTRRLCRKPSGSPSGRRRAHCVVSASYLPTEAKRLA
jgi:hypothetical protein